MIHGPQADHEKAESPFNSILCPSMAYFEEARVDSLGDAFDNHQFVHVVADQAQWESMRGSSLFELPSWFRTTRRRHARDRPRPWRAGLRGDGP